MGDYVEIMTRKISDVKATAHRVFVQSSAATQNVINLIKEIFLINIIEVFDSMSLVHFPAMRSRRQCKCGHK